MPQTALFPQPSPLDRFKVGRTGLLVNGDALTVLRAMAPGVADIVFLDPPFNLGKEYGPEATIEHSHATEYEEYLKRVVDESIRILAPGGALFLYHLPNWALTIGAYARPRLELRHWIAVGMKNGFARGNRLYPAHYALLYMTKGPPARFSRPKVSPLECRVCGELVKDYGGYRAIIEEKGINLSDIWDDISPVRHKHLKHRHANQLPLQLTDRIVAIAGGRGRLLVDPFAGTGTTLVSAYHAKMRFVGADIVKKNVLIMKDRLEKARGAR